MTHEISTIPSLRADFTIAATYGVVWQNWLPDRHFNSQCSMLNSQLMQNDELIQFSILNAQFSINAECRMQNAELIQ
ncbi:MAG: hypothetical protein MJ106_01640, partial [Lentisphaeria bacterium]|nr:hypothetical protein [Lentisphaeria bacterium]